MPIKAQMTHWKVYCVTGCQCSLKSAFKMLCNFVKWKVEKILGWRSLEDTWNGTNINFSHVPPGRAHMPSRIFLLMIQTLNPIMKKHQTSKTSCRMNHAMQFPSQKPRAEQEAVVSFRSLKRQHPNAASLPEWDALAPTVQLWKLGYEN